MIAVEHFSGLTNHPRVFGQRAKLQDLLAKSPKWRSVLRAGSDVVQLIRIFRQVVEFFGRTMKVIFDAPQAYDGLPRGFVVWKWRTLLVNRNSCYA